MINDQREKTKPAAFAPAPLALQKMYGTALILEIGRFLVYIVFSLCCYFYLGQVVFHKELISAKGTPLSRDCEKCGLGRTDRRVLSGDYIDRSCR